jgi:hypothetical protein
MGKEKKILRGIKLVAELKKKLLKNKTAKTIAKKYGLTDSFVKIVDGLSISFDEDLDVSGKTIDGIIYLNEKILKDPKKAMEYVVHEFTHVCQHIVNEGKTKKNKAEKKKDYLNRETELEAFTAQIEEKKNTQGEKEARDYIDDLLDHHKIKSQKKRETIRKMLMGGL